GEDLYSAISQWDNDAGLEYPSVRSYKGGIWRVKDGKTTTSSDFPVSGSSVWEKITDSFNLFRSSNYFSQGTILNNTCVVQVNSVPQITSKTGWQSVLLDVTNITDTNYIIGNINTLGVYAWLDSTDTQSANIVSWGQFQPGETIKNSKGFNAKSLLVDIKRQNDNTSVYQNAFINTFFVNAYSETATFSSLKTSSLVLNLPTSSNSLPSGRAWIDTANGNVIKVVP